jgi:hypothetical protein
MRAIKYNGKNPTLYTDKKNNYWRIEAIGIHQNRPLVNPA